jgi:hypothetical protein
MRALLAIAACLVALVSHPARGQNVPRKPAHTPAQITPHAARAASSADKPAEVPPAATGMVPRGPTRIDFDDRLLQGQTNKLGAVYLYQRRAPAQPSLLARRQGFREEIARDLLE